MSDPYAPRSSPDTATLTIRPLQGCAGLMLAGEADLTNRGTLRASLAALPADGTGEIHLDLTGLRFIDVCCTRELIAITDRHPPVRLIAHDPPASLLRITALMYPESKIKITGRSSPHTGAAGRPDLTADPSCDGFSRDRDGFLMTDRDPAGVTMADVIDLITDDHARIRRLFAALDEFAHDGEQLTGSPAPSGDDRMLGETWSALSRLLDAHIDAEEEICRLAMTAAGQPDDRLEASFADHWDIQEALAEAQLCETGSRRWWRAVADARSTSTRHFRTEEDHVLAAFRRETGREAREILGRQWTAFMLDRLRDDAAGHDPENVRPAQHRGRCRGRVRAGSGGLRSCERAR